MITLENITGFDWDEGNSRKNQDKHGVNQAEAEQVFLNEPLLVLEDNAHNKHEPRFHAYGHTDDGRLLHIAFTLRGNSKLIRIISARDMNRKEREIHAKEKEN